jgi:LmbE family N-acetylglucosaminyl deacetylase
MADKIERVMVITAHPDDSEFGAGGTVAKFVKEGREVAYCVVTSGNKGSSDRTMTPARLAGIRAEEQRTAARVLGVEQVVFLGYPDGEVEDTRDLRRDVSREIRRFRPDPSSVRTRTAPTISAPRIGITASWAVWSSTASIPWPATTWPSRS